MQKITPFAGRVPPSVKPDHTSLQGKCYTVQGGAYLWVLGRLSAGTVKLRPYFWASEADAAGSLKGAWIPLGGDADAGSLPTAFDSAELGGGAHGRYDWGVESRFVVLVEENAAAPTYDFVQVGSV